MQDIKCIRASLDLYFIIRILEEINERFNLEKISIFALKFFQKSISS